jgi:phage tail tape-measure protein
MSETEKSQGADQADREALRDLADAGNEAALDRLADLAEARDDLEELNELLDEGCERAGRYLADRAAARRDLRELQRLAEAGIDFAQARLDQFLR